MSIEERKLMQEYEDLMKQGRIAAAHEVLGELTILIMRRKLGNGVPIRA